MDHARSLSLSQSLSLSFQRRNDRDARKHHHRLSTNLQKREAAASTTRTILLLSAIVYSYFFPHRDLIDRPLRGGDDDERSSIDYTVYAPSVLVRRNSAKVPILWNKQRAALLTIPDGECCAAAHSRPGGKIRRSAAAVVRRNSHKSNARQTR